MYNKRKFGQSFVAKLKRLSKKLVVAKTKAKEAFLRSVLQIEGKCWTEYYKYVK
jgi:CRISPR/Cas system-associated endonuclease Cas1